MTLVAGNDNLSISIDVDVVFQESTTRGSP